MRKARGPRKGRHPRRKPLSKYVPLWNTYEEYLTTAHWRATRALAIKRGSGICARCATARATEVHHLTYKRVGRERPEDLMALCSACHRAEHGQGEPLVGKPGAVVVTPKPHRWREARGTKIRSGHAAETPGSA